MKKVSVVIPAYNSLQFLPQTVDSILAQTFTNFEIMIVDDGSTDGTQTWLAQLEDPRINFITQTNQGQSSARNAGIVATHGEYIAFLDADDLWEPTKLEKQVACLDARPEVGLVHTAIEFIDEQGKKSKRVMSVRGNGDVWQDVVENQGVRCGSTPMVRRSCFQEVGLYDTALTFGEDWDMYIRLAARFHFATLNEPLVFYRLHGANMTKSYQKILPNFLKILARAFQEHPLQDKTLEKKAYAKVYLFVALRALDMGDIQAAAELQRQAYDYYPKILLTKTGLTLNVKLTRARWSSPRPRNS